MLVQVLDGQRIAPRGAGREPLPQSHGYGGGVCVRWADAKVCSMGRASRARTRWPCLLFAFLRRHEEAAERQAPAPAGKASSKGPATESAPTSTIAGVSEAKPAKGKKAKDTSLLDSDKTALADEPEKKKKKKKKEADDDEAVTDVAEQAPKKKKKKKKDKAAAESDSAEPHQLASEKKKKKSKKADGQDDRPAASKEAEEVDDADDSIAFAHQSAKKSEEEFKEERKRKAAQSGTSGAGLVHQMDGSYRA